jgi:hypothetical protein
MSPLVAFVYQAESNNPQLASAQEMEAQGISDTPV